MVILGKSSVLHGIKLGNEKGRAPASYCYLGTTEYYGEFGGQGSLVVEGEEHAWIMLISLILKRGGKTASSFVSRRTLLMNVEGPTWKSTESD